MTGKLSFRHKTGHYFVKYRHDLMSRLNDFEPVKFKIHLTRANRIPTGSSSSMGLRFHGLNPYQRKYEQPKMYQILKTKTRMKYYFNIDQKIL